MAPPEGKPKRDPDDPQSAQALFECAVEAAPVGMVMVDAEGRITLVNRLLADMFGYARVALLGQPIETLIPDRVREVHRAERAEFMGLAQHRTMSGRELFAKHADGHEFPVEVGLNPVALDDEPVVIGTVVDITKRRRAERELAERESRLRAVMDNATDGIAILSPEGVIIEHNARMAEIMGRPGADDIGRHIAEFTPGGFADPSVEGFHRVVPAGGGTLPRVEIRRPDGSLALVDYSVSAFEHAGTRLILAIGRDVTERHGLEEQLRQAQKMEALGRLAGGVAHDFNNLLTAIGGHADFLREAMPPTDPRAEDVEQILAAVRRASGLTRQLLTFSRKSKPETRVLDLAALLRGLERMLRRLIGEDVELVTRLDPDTAPVRADAGQLEQVVMNLALNARDAMPQGGVLLIELDNADLDEDYGKRHWAVTPGHYVRLSVSDTGVGMTEDVQSHIFEPFFTTKELGRGTGLGLASVHGIAESCGGFVWVYSEPGRGSTFKVYLPVAQGSATEAVPAVPVQEEGAETILLVEDEALVRRVAKRALVSRGYTVLEAEGPAQALAVMESHAARIDLLLSDVVMPGGSGVELADTLRRGQPDLAVLLLSGYTPEALGRQGLEARGMAFLSKPYSPDSLARKVREVLAAAAKAP